MAEHEYNHEITLKTEEGVALDHVYSEIGDIISDMNMRDLKNRGRIDIQHNRKQGVIKIRSSMGTILTCAIAAMFESTRHDIVTIKIEDMRDKKRDFITDRAGKLLSELQSRQN